MHKIQDVSPNPEIHQTNLQPRAQVRSAGRYAETHEQVIDWRDLWHWWQKWK